MKPASDNATPSGNGTMAGVLGRLFYLTGKASYRERAEKVIRVFASEANHNPVGLATLLNAYEFLNQALQVTILGDPQTEETRALLRAVHGVSIPNRVLLVVPDGHALPPGHPAAGKERVDGRATCYLCWGPVCDAPITEASALEAALRKPGE